MTTETTLKHTIQAFDADLRTLVVKIAQMSHRDGEQIAHAIEALVTRNATLANRVIAADDEIDSLQRDIEHEAVSTIARRQPMAGDLREIVGALRIANDLERIGDLAENIAKRAFLLPDGFPVDDVMLQLQRMAKLVTEQLSSVIQSYERHELSLALSVWREDREIDALNNSLFRELLTHMMENPANITLCTHLLFCAKNIERMGDHITNIAETVYYIVTGEAMPEERPKADVTSREMLPTSPSAGGGNLR